MGLSSEKAVGLKLRAFGLSLFTITFPILGTLSFYYTLGVGDPIRWTVIILLSLGCLIHQALMVTDACESYDLKYPNEENK